MGEATERLGELLARVVPMHTLADVPVGVFLSGGIDSLAALRLNRIHYAPEQMVAVLARLAADTSGSIVFTFAPATTALRAMHVVGRALKLGAGHGLWGLGYRNGFGR